MQLPPSEAELLVSLRRDLPALRGRVRLLRQHGWTLDSIGAALDSPRSTVRSWELHPSFSPSTHPSAPSPPPPRPSPPPHTPHAIRALAPDVPPDDASRIATLAPLARRVRGGTPPSSPYRLAREELNTLLVHHHHERAVPVARLARIAGVSYRAMKVRLSA